jgi:hypothetical protein
VLGLFITAILETGCSHQVYSDFLAAPAPSR